MIKNRIALCIPTKDRFKCIEELLLDYPRINGICQMDIYIYDSSVDDVIERYVNSYDKSYNVFYKRVKDYHDENGNIYKGTDQAALKLYDIYSEFSGSEKYDYVWVSGDSVRFSDNIFNLLRELHDDYDFVSIIINKLNEYVYEKQHDVFWNNAEEYIKYNTGMNTLFGGVLVNVKALEHIDWKEVSKWYKNTKYLSFSYIRLYAEIAIRSPQFKALSIFAKDGIKWSKYKLDIGWRNDFFEVFYECFINVVNSFPISTKSQKYIIDSFYREDIMLNKSILEYMRTKGYFDINVLNKWKEYMEYAIPYAISKKVADIPREKLIERYTKIKSEFIDFLNSHEKKYIYGAGYFGMKYQAIVEHNGHKIDGFIVSQKGNNPDYIDGYKVLAYDDIKDTMDGVGVILGLNQNNAAQVKSIIKEYVKTEDIYENYDYQVYIYM